jgi:hypothetical protein
MADATIAVATSGAGRVSAVNDLTTIKANITATATVYATASGGLPIDLFSVLRSVSNPAYPINSRDVLGIIGMGPAGQSVGNWALGTPTSTTAPGTIRIFTGGTEQADGAVTATFPVFILLSRGGTN